MSLPDIIWTFVLCGSLIQVCWIKALNSQWGLARFADVPNLRSSHQSIIPRGGGFVFALIILAAIIANIVFHRKSEMVLLIPIISFLLISTVGLLDDLFNLRPQTRLLVHIGCAALLAFEISATVFTDYSAFFIASLIFLTFYGSVAINFFNFADGINGYIGLLGIILALVAIVTGSAITTVSNSILFLLAGYGLLASILVFLYFNVIKRQVFMGDVGSTTLGLFVLFLLNAQYLLVKIREPSINIALFKAILLSLSMWWVVWIDCGTMVIAKIILKYPLSRAHKEHIYQRLSRVKNCSHIKVASLLFLVQVLTYVAFCKLIENSQFLIWIFIFSVLLIISFINNYRALKKSF